MNPTVVHVASPVASHTFTAELIKKQNSKHFLLFTFLILFNKVQNDEVSDTTGDG
jgi:hypothetical protein